MGNQFYSFVGRHTGQFTGLFAASYTKTYLKLYQAAYSGQYTKQWTGVYSKLYLGNYTKTYLGQYTKTYTGVYTKTYTKTYLGNYTKQYGKLWVGIYTKAYEGVFGTSYSKTYGGAWSGTRAGATEVIPFTSSYAKVLSYNKSYVATTTVANTMTGELTDDGGVSRVKEDGEYQQVKTTRVKNNDEWKEVLITRVKEDGVWNIAEVNYERTDHTLTANDEVFSVKDYLQSQGAAIGSRPQHFNLTINSGVFAHGNSSNAAIDITGLSTIQGINHKVKILVKPGGYIIGASGSGGTTTPASRTGSNGSNGGHAIQLGNGVELYIENYGIIAGGGGGGGAGGYPVDGSTDSLAGGAGGKGAGWSSGYVSESNTQLNGTSSAVKYGVHGGNGGLLGQLGIGAGGFDADNSSYNETNPGTSYSQYALSGDGGEPGSAIKGYVASRVSFINNTEESVWGDSAFKFKA